MKSQLFKRVIAGIASAAMIMQFAIMPVSADGGQTFYATNAGTDYAAGQTGGYLYLNGTRSAVNSFYLQFDTEADFTESNILSATLSFYPYEAASTSARKCNFEIYSIATGFSVDASGTVSGLTYNTEDAIYSAKESIGGGSDVYVPTNFTTGKYVDCDITEYFKENVTADGSYAYMLTTASGNTAGLKIYATGDYAPKLTVVTVDGEIYTVTYNYADSQVATENVAQDTCVASIPDTAYTAYIFQGWNKDDDTETLYTTEEIAAMTITADTTFTAVYISELEAMKMFYKQDFESFVPNSDTSADGIKAATVWTSPNMQDALDIVTGDETYGKYLSYAHISTQNSRGAYSTDLGDLDLSGADQYIIEFDLSLTTGNSQGTEFVIGDNNLAYYSKNVNYGAESGYLIKMAGPANSTTWTINDVATATIPAGTFCHYWIYVDKATGYAYLTVTNGEDVYVDELAVALNNTTGNIGKLYVLSGRYSAVTLIDNIVVREVLSTDVPPVIDYDTEALSSISFTSVPDTVISQPGTTSDDYVEYTIALNAIGTLGSDLTDNLDNVVWTINGFEGEDGYVLFDGITDVDGNKYIENGKTSVVMRVRNGVGNYYCSITATATRTTPADSSVETKSATTNFAILGSSGDQGTQIIPVMGYPTDYSDFGDSLVGYKVAANALGASDVIMNGWSCYGSNGSRTLTLMQDDAGVKYFQLLENGGSGSTVMHATPGTITSQFLVDFTMKFSSATTLYYSYLTPNNSDNDTAAYISYSGGTLSLNATGATIAGIPDDEWVRVILSIDLGAGECYAIAYNEAGELIGKTDVVPTDSTTMAQRYISIMGAPANLAAFKVYYPTGSEMTVGSSQDVISVPEEGEDSVSIDLAAYAYDLDGYSMSGEVTFALAEDYANVELTSTGSQTAQLTVSEGAAAGEVVVTATKGSLYTEKVISLTTSKNNIAFTSSTTSVTIPFEGGDAVVAEFAAENRTGDGTPTEEGGAITLALYDKNNAQEVSGITGITFENGVLTVTSSANPGIYYVRATNEDGISASVKVNIHSMLFAFGSDEPEDGYTQVTASTMYTEKLGFGFADTSMLSDGSNYVAGSSAFRFKATVPNGNYVVAVDTTAGSMTSEVVETVSASTGISKSGTSFQVAVCDGVLDLTFNAGDVDLTITSLQISQATKKSALAKPAVYAIGDSTTKNNANGALSWGNVGGTFLPDCFSSFNNHGMAGRDSVNFYNQARVEAVLLAIAPGDYVTINMGINSTESGEGASYETMIRDYYVKGVMQRGAIPVILTATPQGPVGNYTGNYDSTNQVFNCTRGDGARNNILRSIAAELNVNLIDVGTFGNDYFNSLVTELGGDAAYAAVQAMYVDHNHYKEELANVIAPYILGELAELYAAETITFDVENDHESITVSDVVVSAAGEAVEKDTYLVVYNSDLTFNQAVAVADGTATATGLTAEATYYYDVVDAYEDGAAIESADGYYTVTLDAAPVADPYSFTDVEVVEGVYSVIFTANDDDYDACLAVAVYDESGALVAIDFDEKTIEMGQNGTLSVTMTTEGTVKTFIWDSIESMIPYL